MHFIFYRRHIQLVGKVEELCMSKYHTKEIQYVKSVTIRVKDIVKMLDFYINFLKFSLLDKKENRYYLGTNEGVVLLILEDNLEANRRGKTTGLYHFAILLPTRKDLGVILRHSIMKKFPLTGLSDHHVSEAIYLDDPEGNGIEIYADRPDEEWVFIKEGVYMTTERMDYQSVLKEAEESARYQMLPAKTVMGHLHLHVNNIKAANDFWVDVLGFNKVLEYGPSATFISDAKYHHHIAYNTWLGTTNRNMDEKDLGLIEYHVNLPKNRVESLLGRLDGANITYQLSETQITLKDINGTSIIFDIA